MENGSSCVDFISAFLLAYFLCLASVSISKGLFGKSGHSLVPNDEDMVNFGGEILLIY